MRFKRTVVCQTCAKLKNVCQTCIFDLQYGASHRHHKRPTTIHARWAGPAADVVRTCGHPGLPVQVRDQVLRTGGNPPRGAINREYFAQNAEAQVRRTRTGTAAWPVECGSPRWEDGGTRACLQMADGILPVDYSKGALTAHEELEKMARRGPYYKRNLPHVCSFFVKGFCSRGDECPYRCVITRF
jgi:pre-mRNA-splicing factor RBM22/SLT11